MPSQLIQRLLPIGAAIIASCVAAPARAQSTTEKPAPPKTEEQKPADVEELRRRLELLASEVEQLRSGEETRTPLTDEQRRLLGLGPSAAAVYEKKGGVSLSGYGEMLYENFDSGDQSGASNGPASKIDFLRAILYAGYRFNDRFIFNSEIEIEHAHEEVGLEFAYLDFRVNDNLTLRGGMLLLPLGLVNEFHEPNVFLGARRPLVEQRIIPTTWRENGFGAVGSKGRVSYRAYVVAGLDAANFSASGIRAGRQEGAESRAADWAFAGRLDFTPAPGTVVGTGLYSGGSDQGRFPGIDAGTTIVELHAQTQMRGVDARALYARTTVGDVAALNAALDLSGADGIGSRQQGGYAQIGYNVLSQRATRTALTPYYRVERLNTHADVPAGFQIDPARDITQHTVGVEVKPIPNVVVKTDYTVNRNKARTGRNQFNVALGYSF
jgi:hypothetical protein